MRVCYHKLVREGIPCIIQAGGGQPVTRVLDQAGYLAALRAKLMEEARGSVRGVRQAVAVGTGGRAGGSAGAGRCLPHEPGGCRSGSGRKRDERAASADGSFSNTSTKSADYRAGTTVRSGKDFQLSRTAAVLRACAGAGRVDPRRRIAW